MWRDLVALFVTKNTRLPISWRRFNTVALSFKTFCLTHSTPVNGCENRKINEWNKKASKMKQREKNWVRINVLFSYCCCSHQDVNVLRRTHLTYMCTMVCCCVFISNFFFRLLSLPLSCSCHHRCRNWLVVYVKNFMPIFRVKLCTYHHNHWVLYRTIAAIQCLCPPKYYLDLLHFL